MASPAAETFSPIRWSDGTLHLLDQTLLPREEVWIRCDDPETVATAIRRLSVRGAPAIGVSAAYGLAVGLKGTSGRDALERRFAEVSELLGSTRPTAVNLRWALEQGAEVFAEALGDPERVETPGGMAEHLRLWADGLHAADIRTNRTLGDFGSAEFQPGDRVLTHCNAGALATAGYGTAIGVIQSSWDRGSLAKVWVDETRPLLQGARLTTWELDRLEIPYQLITDSSAGALMARGEIDRVVVGADRIAANGDTANKIGTYTAAVLAARHGIPFYVAAPLSTIDRRAPTGADIPIEIRESAEVTEVFGTRVAPADSDAMNLAFDVTPNDLIAGIITEAGVLRAPYTDSIAKAFEEAG